MAKRRKKNAAKQRSRRPKKPSCGERVRLMKDNFIVHHNAGYTVRDIARMYDLGESTVYDSLSEIAEKSNVSRESLLWKVKNTTTVPANGSATHSEAPEPQVEPSEPVSDEVPVMSSDTSSLVPQEVIAEYEENQQTLSALLEVTEKLETAIAQALKEEHAYD